MARQVVGWQQGGRGLPPPAALADALRLYLENEYLGGRLQGQNLLIEWNDHHVGVSVNPNNNPPVLVTLFQ